MVHLRRTGTVIVALAVVCSAFRPQSRLPMQRRAVGTVRMSVDVHSVAQMVHDIPTWAQLAAQGMADASSAIAVSPDAAAAAVSPDEFCVAIGQDGFSPLCWLGKLNPFKVCDCPTLQRQTACF